jgi:prepilin-type N-terminal cleavage/methylation domain-containing protein
MSSAHRFYRRPRRADITSSGFTLVELLITLIVISILSLSLAAFIATWLQASTLAQARSDLLANAENALDAVNTDIRLSGSADQDNRWQDANAPSGPLSWHSDSQTLVLAKAATDSSGNVIFSDPAKYITQKDNEVYYLDGTTLYRRTLASPDASDAAVTTCPPTNASPSCPADKTVATGVSSFTVQYYDANETQVEPSSARSIQLSITLSSVQNGHALSASYNTRMVFRNK